MKIPNNAKIVFKGKIFNVYQWEQELYDGSKQTFEMLSRISSTDVIGTIGDKIIVLVQEQPTKPKFYGLPGGRVEEGEDALIAVKRELLEETGYVSEGFILFKEYFGYPKIYFHESLFIARDCKKIKKQDLDAGEKIKVKLMSFDNFLKLCRKPNLTVPVEFKFMMYEALLDEKKKRELKKAIFG